MRNRRRVVLPWSIGCLIFEAKSSLGLTEKFFDDFVVFLRFKTASAVNQPTAGAHKIARFPQEQLLQAGHSAYVTGVQPPFGVGTPTQHTGV